MFRECRRDGSRSTALDGGVAAEMRTFSNSFGHVISPTANFQYTFDSDELERAVQQEAVAAIVHHGDAPAFTKHVLVYSHDEGLTLFASSASGASCVTSEDLASILSGRIVNWSEIGGNDLPIELGVRADGIFMRSSQAILRRHSLHLTANVHASQSYGDLAAYASSKRGALVIGLRGRSSRTAMLTELRVDGARVSGPNAGPYPLSISISLLLRRDSPLAVQLGRDFAESLAANGREDRLEADVSEMTSRLLTTLNAIEAAQSSLKWAVAS